MANLLFYKKPVPLNKKDHKDKKISAENRSFDFASGTNSVILAGVEFSEAAKEYPIVFAQAGEQVVPVALLGLRNEENLYVDSEGKWDAKYVPAFVRRYPFVLAETGETGQRAVCIDEDYPGFSDDTGQPLFDGEETTPILQQALDFLEEYQKQYVRTEAFVNRLRENDLLMALNAKVDMEDGQQFGLSGLLAVDERKLLQLSDEAALAMFRTGELSWIYCHLMSMGCMGHLVERVARLSSAAAKSTEAKSTEAKSGNSAPAAKPKPKAKSS